MIEIRKLNKYALQAYIDSQEYKTAPHIAISHHRAQSQINNPRTEENDILLFLAYESGQMVGYLGALADDIYDIDGQRHHFAWMSCLWIDPTQRGKNIASKLVKACFLAWDNRILLTEYTGPAANLYHKLGLFSELPELHGRRWYIQSDLTRILPPKNNFFNKIKFLLTAFDSVTNAVLRIGTIFRKQPISLNFTNEINEELAKFIIQYNSKTGIQRDGNLLQWILQYPWIIESKSTAKFKRYYFSSVADQFVSKAIIIHNDKNEMEGCILINIRDGHLKIPFLYHKGSLEKVAVAIKSVIRQYQVKTLTLYHPALIDYFHVNKKLSAFSKALSRKYLISSVFWEQLGRISLPLCAGDGDTVFT